MVKACSKNVFVFCTTFFRNDISITKVTNHKFYQFNLISQCEEQHFRCKVKKLWQCKVSPKKFYIDDKGLCLPSFLASTVVKMSKKKNGTTAKGRILFAWTEFERRCSSTMKLTCCLFLLGFCSAHRRLRRSAHSPAGQNCSHDDGLPSNLIALAHLSGLRLPNFCFGAFREESPPLDCKAA